MTRDEIIKELNDIGGDSEKWSREDAIWLVEVSGEIIAELKAELAKFHECEHESALCNYGRIARFGHIETALHVLQTAPYSARKVYHKDGE